MQARAEAARAALPGLATPLWNAAEALREATEAFVAQPMNDDLAGAVPYLRAFARVLGGDAHLKAACADSAREPLARFYIRRLLPEHAALLAQLAGSRWSLRRHAQGIVGVSDGLRFPFETPPAEAEAIQVAQRVSSGCACRCRWRLISSECLCAGRRRWLDAG